MRTARAGPRRIRPIPKHSDHQINRLPVPQTLAAPIALVQAAAPPHAPRCSSVHDPNLTAALALRPRAPALAAPTEKPK